MRRSLSILSLAAVLASCSSPRPAPVPVTPAPSPSRGALIGLTATQLMQRLGPPLLSIREGDSRKVQYRLGPCVLDAYLYPDGGRVERVLHVDARTPAGDDMPDALCLANSGR